jgi:serine/threonine protein kinase
MLYEMLAGEVPFKGDSPLAIMNQHVNSDPPRLRWTRSDVPPELEAIVLRAMQRDPSQRYQSMAELKHDLEHLDEVDVAAVDNLVMYRPRGPMPSALKVVMIMAAVFAVLALIGTLAEAAHRSGLGH